MPTSTPRQQGRVNLGDLKSQIEKQLGSERAQHYFSFLSRLLTQKLSKPEFNRFCLRVLGRENIPLHNRLIRSILKNAYLGKAPPPFVDKSALKLNGAIGKKSLQSNDSVTPNSLLHCNGNIPHSSPHKSRRSIRDANGQPNFLGTLQSCLPPDESVVRENGVLGPCDCKRPLQNHQGGTAEQPAKKSRTKDSLLSDQIPLHVNNLSEPVAKEDGNKIEESSDVNSTTTPLHAPLGIFFHPGGIRRCWFSTRGARACCNCDQGVLCHSEDLRKCMEKITEVHGLGVTLDCANLLNNAVDIFLKRLIVSSAELARAKSMPGQIKHPFSNPDGHAKLFNGISPGNHMHVQSSGTESIDANHMYKTHYMVSSHDFKLAIELNPQLLGDVWPLLFEKICFCSFGE